MKWFNAPMVLAGVALISLVGVVIEPLIGLFPDYYLDDISEMVGRGGGAIIITCVVVPVIEELLFRGLFFAIWRRLLRGYLWLGVVVSAVVFGAAHLPNWPQVVNALLGGVVLGYVFLVTRSLPVVMVIHAVNNALAYLVMVGGWAGELRAVIASGVVYWVVWVMSLAVVAISLVLMHNKLTQNALDGNEAV